MSYFINTMGWKVNFYLTLLSLLILQMLWGDESLYRLSYERSVFEKEYLGSDMRFSNNKEIRSVYGIGKKIESLNDIMNIFAKYRGLFGLYDPDCSDGGCGCCVLY